MKPQIASETMPSVLPSSSSFSWRGVCLVLVGLEHLGDLADLRVHARLR